MLVDTGDTRGRRDQPRREPALKREQRSAPGGGSTVDNLCSLLQTCEPAGRVLVRGQVRVH